MTPGEKVAIVGGPLGKCWRRLDRMTRDTIVLRPAVGPMGFTFAWDGRLVTGPEAFWGSRILPEDLDRLQRSREDS